MVSRWLLCGRSVIGAAGFDNCGFVTGFDFDQGLSAQAALGTIALV